MIRQLLLRLIVLSLAVASTPGSALLADGGKAKNVVYNGEARPQAGAGSFQFTIDSSPIIFYLGTVNNKYHVLLIRVKNNTDSPLNLARDQDSIELVYSEGHKVKAILNLRAADPSTWDGLETEIRTAVAYPDLVEPREEEGIYVYIPKDDLKAPRKTHEMPVSIIYSIKSLKDAVELRRRGVAAA